MLQILPQRQVSDWCSRGVDEEELIKVSPILTETLGAPIASLGSFSQTTLPFDPWADFETVTTVSPSRNSVPMKTLPLDSTPCSASNLAITSLAPPASTARPQTTQLSTESGQVESRTRNKDASPGAASGVNGEPAEVQQTPSEAPVQQDREQVTSAGTPASCEEASAKSASNVEVDQCGKCSSISASKNAIEREGITNGADYQDVSSQQKPAEKPFAGEPSPISGSPLVPSSAVSVNDCSERMPMQPPIDGHGNRSAILDGVQQSPSIPDCPRNSEKSALTSRSSEGPSILGDMSGDAVHFSVEQAESEPVDEKSSNDDDDGFLSLRLDFAGELDLFAGLPSLRSSPLPF